MEERENFYRFSALLLDVGAIVLREVFTCRHLKSDTLATYLSSNESILRKLPLSVLRQEHLNILFPNSGNNASIKDFDITLMYVLFRNLDSTEESESPVWSSPSEKDHSFQADIGRIRLIRNTVFAHVSSTSLDKSTFNKEASNLKAIYLRLISALPASRISLSDLQQMIERELTGPLQPDLDNKMKLMAQQLEEWQRYDQVSNIPFIKIKVRIMTQNGSIIQNAEMKLKDIIATGSFVFSFDIGSVVINVEAGSVIIRLQPLSKHAQETLSFFCQHGGMKDYVLNLLRKKDVFKTLPTGEIYIDVEVSYHTDEVSEEAYISQEALENKNFEVVENPQVIKENLLLQYGSLLEELEPLDLQKIFIGKGILDKSVFEEFTNLQRRARASDFLKKVLHKGNDALNALVVALKDSGRQNLATKLCYFQKKTTHFGDTEQVNDTLVQVVEEVSNMHADEAVLWSCRLDLLIGRHPDAGGNDWYPGVVCLPEQKLLLVDCRVNTTKLYDRGTGDLLTESTRMKSRPWDVCVFDESKSQVAVALGNGTIEILSIQSTGSSFVITPVRTIKTNLKVCHSVRTMTIGDQLIVSGRSASGMLCWCLISTLDEKVGRIHNICRYGSLGSCYMALNKGKSTVYFSCATGAKSGNTGVYGYDVESGVCKVKYHDRDLSWPKGICLDNIGYIYICNQYPPCIHQLKENGEQVQVFKKGMPSMLRAICLDENRNFLVTCWRNNRISTFQMLWNKHGNTR